MLRNLLGVLTFVATGHSPAWRTEAGAYADHPFEVAIVAGCPSNEDGTVSACQLDRATWAAALYHEGSVDNLIVSGGAVYNAHVEAEALAAILRGYGVPAEHVLIEPVARHTDENAQLGVELAHRRGWERIAVVSSPVHAVLIDKMLGRWGIEATALPIDRRVVEAALRDQGDAVSTLRTPAVADWIGEDAAVGPRGLGWRYLARALTLRQGPPDERLADRQRPDLGATLIAR